MGPGGCHRPFFSTIHVPDLLTKRPPHCRAFAATAGEKVYESLQVWAQGSGATVEEDKVVSIDKQHS